MLYGIKPRDYQANIFETCKNNNCLVVLPTGMGKTLIALMLAIERQKQFPSSKVLFLAPTRPLANQHLNYFKKHLPELYGQFELFTGKVEPEKRRRLWQDADVIFSTPQTVANDLKSGSYNLGDVSLLIEDECHRCLKNYDYVYMADEYKKTAKNSRILGLTASPGSDASVIHQICKNLGIEKVEIRTRMSNDVKEYVQELKAELVKVELPEEFLKIRNLLNEIFDKRVQELKNRKLLFAPVTKKNLLDLQHRIMKAIGSGNKHFNLLKGASTCAQAIKLQHALEMIETQGSASLHEYMKDLYEQAAKSKSVAAKQLVKDDKLNQAYILCSELTAGNIEHPKLKKVREIVEEEINKNPKAKILVFAQYRNTVARICKKLNSIEGINARVFIGQAVKDGQGLSQKEQQELISEFSLNKINVLVCTSIGEEGLDLPEVSCVIFYEPVPSAIRRIQRAGRTARLMPGKLIILMTVKTRDESYHYASLSKERKMHGILEGINKGLKEKKRQKSLKDFAEERQEDL